MKMIIEKKLKLFGHISRTDENWMMKNEEIGIVEGQNRRGRSRDWMDDTKEWCRTDVTPAPQIKLNIC